MSLEGTLETTALPDVIALLSATSKTGELRVESGQVAGSVWMSSGRISGFELGNSRSAANALFTLLRLSEGNFYFRFYFRAEGAEPPARCRRKKWRHCSRKRKLACPSGRRSVQSCLGCPAGSRFPSRSLVLSLCSLPSGSSWRR